METKLQRTEPTRTGDPGGSRLLQDGVSAAAIATVVNLWLVNAATEVFAVSPAFVLLEFWHVVNTTVGVTFVATLVYAATTQYASTDRPERTFTRISLAALVLSYVPFLLAVPGRPGATTEAIAVLAALHLTTAIVVVTVLVRWTHGEGGRGP